MSGGICPLRDRYHTRSFAMSGMFQTVKSGASSGNACRAICPKRADSRSDDADMMDLSQDGSNRHCCLTTVTPVSIRQCFSYLSDSDR